MNLLLNARDAITRAGRDGVIHIRTRHVDDKITVEIEDNGSRINPDDLPRIFDPAFTTRQTRVGFGLGLAISYRIAQSHGGTIRASSRAGEGAMFTVELPVKG